MDIDVISLFPEYLEGPFNCSMLKRARDQGLLNLRFIDIRDFSDDKHKTVDDRPYGGGPGMVLKAEPIVKAIRSVKRENSHVIYFSPQGKVLKAAQCERYAKRYDHIILLCGHYEGVDQRVIDLEVDEEISIGDYVLTSGLPATTVFVDAVSRFIPGVIGHPDAVYQDSFHTSAMFDGPQYTRPEVFENLTVPDILLSGHHEKIDAWKREEAHKKVLKMRPEFNFN